MKSPLLDALETSVLVFDGAMGTQLQLANLDNKDFAMPRTGSALVEKLASSLNDKPLDGCNEILNLTRPDVVESIHRAYLAAGADLIETNTFGSTSIVLGEYAIEELVYEISFAAAGIARKAADAYSTNAKPRFVVGALGPGTKLVSLSQTTWDEIVSTYSLSFGALIDGKVDALLLETMQDLLLLKAAVFAAKQAMDERAIQLPLIAQVTIEQTGTMLLGTEIGAAINMLEAFPHVTAIGMNCATGPVEMAPYVRYLGQHSSRPISIQPNAGLPLMEHGKAVYSLTPSDLAHHQSQFVNDYGAAMVGGCCGTTPEHVKAIVDAVGGKPHSANAHWIMNRQIFNGFDFNLISEERAQAISLIGCSSLFQFQSYIQDNSLLLVGEKTNANGSKAFRDMLSRENWEGLTELAREQENEGSHLLDVCTAYVGRDEVRDMTTLLTYYNKSITIPLVIDSTEVPVIEAALKKIAGKPIVNSINFEDGGTRAHKVLDLCQRYGAGVVALTIDEHGMAKAAKSKSDIADRLISLAHEYGLPNHDIFIDALTFTLGSGDEEFRLAGLETLEAIRMIKANHHNVNTILGISNISFGLRPAIRQVINSTFLHFAIEAGLTSAIVHVSKILPENQIEPEVWKLATDLVNDQRKFSA